MIIYQNESLLYSKIPQPGAIALSVAMSPWNQEARRAILVYRLARKPPTVVDEVRLFGSLFQSRIVLVKKELLYRNYINPADSRPIYRPMIGR